MAKTTEVKTEEVNPEVDNIAVLEEIKAREKHMEEMFAQMLALKNEATAQTVQNAKNTVSLPEEIQKREDKLHEMVKIKLRKDRNSKLSDLFVCVNGKKPRLIKRGVEVEVPRYVAKVIEDAEEQEERAIDYCEELANKFVKETEELGG